jgi:hypothetical protein
MAAPTGVESPPSFLFQDPDDFLTPVGQAINADFLGDEDRIVRRLANAARLDPAMHDAVQVTARQLVEAVRRAPASKTGLDVPPPRTFLAGRRDSDVPRGGTAADSMTTLPTGSSRTSCGPATGPALGDSQSLFVNASTWGLMLTGRSCVSTRTTLLPRPAR